MPANKIHIGTSGWSYKDWKGIYYPKDLKSTEWLSYYTKDFNCTEINTSFYHLPKQKTVTTWAEKVPKQFKFCPKISRYLTHMKKLHNPEEPLQRFFSVFDSMKKNLGPVLIQLPPSLAFNEENAKHFFDVLKTFYGDYDFSVEARHKTWLDERSIELLKNHKIGWVISQSGVDFPYEELKTAKHVYVRFHGPGKLYASKYTDKMLQQYADKFLKWQTEGYAIWAFFNNDWYANAIQNAKTLEQMLIK